MSSYLFSSYKTINIKHIHAKNNFRISVPPYTPQVISGDKRIDTRGSIAGVYNENDVMDLTCISRGGN